jgi:hypothetical protein
VVAPPLPPLPVDPFWLVWVGFLLAGTLIAAKRPGNRVGLVLLLIGVSAAVGAFTSTRCRGPGRHRLGQPARLHTDLLSGAVTDTRLPVRGASLDEVATVREGRWRDGVRWVNRRFNRSMYHAQVVVEAFTETLRDRVHPEEVVDGWTDVVSETMEPAAMGVWVRDSE